MYKTHRTPLHSVYQDVHTEYRGTFSCHCCNYTVFSVFGQLDDKSYGYNKMDDIEANKRIKNKTKVPGLFYLLLVCWIILIIYIILFLSYSVSVCMYWRAQDTRGGQG